MKIAERKDDGGGRGGSDIEISLKFSLGNGRGSDTYDVASRPSVWIATSTKVRQGHFITKHINNDCILKSTLFIGLNLVDIIQPDGGGFTHMPVLMTSFPFKGNNYRINLAIVRKHINDRISGTSIKSGSKFVDIFLEIDALLYSDTCPSWLMTSFPLRRGKMSLLNVTWWLLWWNRIFCMAWPSCFNTHRLTTEKRV